MLRTRLRAAARALLAPLDHVVVTVTAPRDRICMELHREAQRYELRTPEDVQRELDEFIVELKVARPELFGSS